MMILFRLLFLIYLTHGEFLFFEHDSYEFHLLESTSIHTKIGSIRATASSSLSIQYKLYGDTNQTFDFNPTTGDFFLRKSLDYESIRLHKLTIEASSSSSIASSFSEILIHVLNTNDNPPDLNVVFFQSNLIKYNLQADSTPLATITIKDLDESTKNLSLFLNDTEHFQIQLIRQTKNKLITESIYILSTKNNSQLIHQEFYYLSLNSCDNDQPSLWTNRSYEFRMKPNENLCRLEKETFIDIRENLPNRTIIVRKMANDFCGNLTYSIDDPRHFSIDMQRGFLYTSTSFNRAERSIYQLNVKAMDQSKKEMSKQLTIRIVDEYGHIPFLLKRRLRIHSQEFSSIDLYNSSSCRYQTRIYDSFRLLTNCTLMKVSPVVLPGKYLFYLQLNDQINYEDTFLLELTSNFSEEVFLAIVQSQWMIIIPIIFAIFLILLIMICAMGFLRKRTYDRILQAKQKSLVTSEENVHHSK